MEHLMSCLKKSYNICASCSPFEIVAALLVTPLVLGVIGFRNSTVIIGLWHAPVIWTYYCVLKTNKLGVVLRSLVLLLLPIPLVLWPVFGITGSVVGGVAYRYFATLIATFEAVGETTSDKFYHCFMLLWLPCLLM